MSLNLTRRTIIIALVLLVSVWGLLSKNIRLGLDLVGGTSMIVQVQMQDAFNAQAQSAAERLRDEMTKARVAFRSIDVRQAGTLQDLERLQITVPGVDSEASFRQIAAQQLTQWSIAPNGPAEFVLTLKPTDAAALRRDVYAHTRQVIERKINAYGLSEAPVQPYGRDNTEYLVQLPHVSDPSRIREILKRQAVLSWHAVREGPFESREQALAEHRGFMPPHTLLLASVGQGNTPPAWYLLADMPVVHGADIRDAHAGLNQFGRWVTNFTLSQDAAQRFARYTEATIGQRAAILLDNQIASVGVIESRIADAGEITAPSQEAASDLSVNLKAGALPSRVAFLEERTVEPSLGADSIRHGIEAALSGLAAVVFTMIAYYRRSGINATVALFLNAILLMAALSYCDAVLTLPGIAGVALTIGMAVDSNVLIFERIREESRDGKAWPAAVAGGFRKAFATIIDTHVTTVVSCCFLFLFGTAPVKGFAITLFIGLLANVFTAVFVSRTMFGWEYRYSNSAMLKK
jgi:preprotein translocase subunit SecD